MPYNCLYLNKGNYSSVKGLILTKLVRYWESMVLIICTKNELNLTNRYWDMVLDRRKVLTDGRRQNYIPPTSLGDNKKYLIGKRKTRGHWWPCIARNISQLWNFDPFLFYQENRVKNSCYQFARIDFLHSSQQFFSCVWIRCLAQGHITVTPPAVRLEPATLCSPVTCSTDWATALHLVILVNNIRINHECEIEKSVLRITVWHHKACRVMTNGYRGRQNFLSHPHTNNRFYLLTIKYSIFFILKKVYRSSWIR